MEQWKPIRGFEKYYMISNLGRVLSLRKNKILKPIKHPNGYVCVNLYDNNYNYCRYIHRLVAEHFIKNPEYKPCVNHLDYNKENNSADNLEWCTYQENDLYSNWKKYKPKKVTHSNTGEKYITYCKSRKYYRVVIKQSEKIFHALELAIEYRDAKIKELNYV